MRELAEVLASDSSTLPPFVRAAALGFRAQLSYLQGKASDTDPAQDGLRGLLATLDEALALRGDSGTSNASIESLPTGLPAPLVSSESLTSRWSATSEGKNLLVPGGKELSPSTLYLLTWRLTPAAAKAWRAEWHAEYPDASGGVDVAGPFDESLIPGVASSSTATPLTLNLSTGGPLTERLARIVSTAIWFAENDSSLRFCLQSAYRFGFAPMQDIHKQRYVSTVRDRLERFSEAEQTGSSEEMLRACVAVDEAVHSLVHQPLAHPQSSYAKIGLASRNVLSEVRSLADEAGLSPHVQVIAGNFADALRLTENADIEGQGSGTPGDVIHCCRVYLSIGGMPSPGRVIYKPRNDPMRS